MAPNIPLTGRYARYKAGTAKIVGWLARTANICCDITKIVASLRSTRNQQQATAGATVDLRTSELIKLADAIAEADPRVLIPADIILTCKSVVDGRQESADRHAADASYKGNGLTEEDKSHQHFIGVLQQVLHVLEIARAAALDGPVDAVSAAGINNASTKKKNESKSAAKKTALTNAFEGLVVEDPVGFTGHVHHAKRPAAALLDLSKANFKLDKEAEDRAFALWCHLQDMDDVRVFVRQTWLQYSSGDISFMLASITTEVAFGLLRCANAEFSALYSELDNYDKILHFLGLDVDIYIDLPVAYIVNTNDSKARKDADINVNIAELLCPAGATILRFHVDNIARIADNEAAKKAGKQQCEEFRPATAWAKADGFTDAIMRSALRLVVTDNNQKDRIDDFIRGFYDLPRADARPTWLVVACQTYIDIFAILGNKTTVGTDFLKSTLQSMLNACDLIHTHREGNSNDILDYKDGKEDLCVQWSHFVRYHAPRALRQLENNTDHMDSGVYGPDFEKDLNKYARGRNHYLTGVESRFPVQAGGDAFLLKLQLADKQTYTVNHSMFIQSMAYLYKAARHLGLLKREWHDMDFVIASQASGGPQGPMVPKFRPDAKAREIMVAFMVATGMGTPAVNYRSKTPPMPNIWTKEAKQVYVPNFTRSFIRSIDPEDSSKPFSSSSPSKMIEALLHRLTSEDAPKDSQHKSTSNGKQSTQRESFTPLELLMTFKKSFMHDEPSINFGYLRFWHKCGELLRNSMETIKEEFPSVHEGWWNGDELAVTVWLMLREVSMFQDTPAACSAKTISDTLLAKAVKVIEPYIIEHGRDFTKAAYDQSSGRIPKHLRPSCAIEYCKKLLFKEEKSTRLRQVGTSVAWSGEILSLYHPKANEKDVSAAVHTYPEDVSEDGIPLPGYMTEGGKPISLGPDLAPAKVWMPKHEDDLALREEIEKAKENISRWREAGRDMNERVSQEEMQGFVDAVVKCDQQRFAYGGKSFNEIMDEIGCPYKLRLKRVG